MIIKSDDGALNLVAGILGMARKDYIDDPLRWGPGIRGFLRSEYGQLMLMGNDPEGIIENLNLQLLFRKWQNAKGCSGCQKKKCEFKNRDSYVEKKWICPKPKHRKKAV